MPQTYSYPTLETEDDYQEYIDNMHEYVFDQWLVSIDEIVMERMGVSRLDLRDFAYRDWYDSGMSPEQAVEEMLLSLGE